MNDFTSTFTVDKTPQQAFEAITNVRGWWSEEVAGVTDQVGGEFAYHYQDVHRCTVRVTKLEPGRKVAWHVVDNYFNFIKDQGEWKDTDIVFEICERGGGAEVRFTHVGLLPEHECYDVCSSAWGGYIGGSLRNLILSGQGQPNPREDGAAPAHQDPATENRRNPMRRKDFTTSFTVDNAPDEVFAAINNVRGWWSEEVVGETTSLGDTFTFEVQGVHRTTQTLTEVVAGRKVVWHVTNSWMGFVDDKTEWDDTDIVFDIIDKGANTEVRFTHVGLTPSVECYEGCSAGWSAYMTGSLRDLITTGQGDPHRAGGDYDSETAKYEAVNNAAVIS